ncbi:hypothetical protein A3A36_02045 [Candidatus Kaiserbacteria bacterium RIFCSPLOWO2_01_FULL_52_12b]|uniref:DUF5652 domain-containing protein n=1 Tax=Candidatus Kaiserbacteria bacterium RIFCSPLOWO2_01_FULL_52_12b TaxID=1798509 RepID=A0A1F6EXV1_9BACT|nr:MAG: hypothetical protein A3A36_02045 [Candidatus Kaiserbacteria bacterium RIFCSPLOWO2_01_FULL_52_12b]
MEVSPIANYSPFFVPVVYSVIILIIAVVIWSVIIKGFALWHAARASQTGWFVSLLVINTLGILEIIYLIWFRPQSTSPSFTTPASSARESSSPQA